MNTALVCSFKDLVGRWLANLLPIGQVRMKSYLTRKRIYLSQTTGQHFFRALTLPSVLTNANLKSVHVIAVLDW